MAEGLLPIPDWPDYGATPDGRIWAIGSNWRGYGAREMKLETDSDGYRRIRFTANGERKRQVDRDNLCRA